MQLTHHDIKTLIYMLPSYLIYCSRSRPGSFTARKSKRGFDATNILVQLLAAADEAAEKAAVIQQLKDWRERGYQ
jgi:hypothetical protein